MAKRKGWNPPAQGTKAREKMPDSAFLMPSEKKYPFKVKRDGEWVVSERGLMAALKRAAQHGETAVENKARKKLNVIRKKKGKEPLEG